MDPDTKDFVYDEKTNYLDWDCNEVCMLDALEDTIGEHGTEVEITKLNRDGKPMEGDD